MSQSTHLDTLLATLATLATAVHPEAQVVDYVAGAWNVQEPEPTQKIMSNSCYPLYIPPDTHLVSEILYALNLA